jgi:hypothetical protein
MKIRLLLIILVCSFLSLSAQDADIIKLKGFGEIPISKVGNNYLANFGKHGSFILSGKLNPLNLEATVSVEQLRNLPGFKVFSNIGLQNAKIHLSPVGFKITAAADTKKNLGKLLKSLNVGEPALQVSAMVSTDGFALEGILDFTKNPIIWNLIPNKTRITIQRIILEAGAGFSCENKGDAPNQKKKSFGIDEPTIGVKTEMLIKPTQWDKDLRMVSQLTYDLISQEITGAGSIVDTWKNPFGLSQHFKNDAVVLTNTAVQLGWIPGSPSFTSIGFIIENGKFFDLEFSMGLSIAPANGEVALMAKRNEITLNDLTTILRKGFNLKVPDIFPDDIYIKDAEVLFSPNGGQVGEFVIERGFALGGKAKISNAFEASINFYVNEEDGFLLSFDLDANIRETLMKEFKKVKSIAPVMDLVLSSFEVEKIQLLLKAGTDLSLAGKTYVKLSIFDRPLEFEWSGKFDPESLVKDIVKRVSDLSAAEIAEIVKRVNKAVVEAGKASKKIAADAWDEAGKLADQAKTASKHMTHSQKECDKECVPKHAKKLYKPLEKGSKNAVDRFYEGVIRELVAINGENPVETANQRSQYVKAEWDQLLAQIDRDWKKIRDDRTYVRFYLMPDNAADGGRRFRKIIDEEHQSHITYRETIWQKMMSERPGQIKEVALKSVEIPVGTYHFQSVAAKELTKGFLEFPGKNPGWAKNGNKMGIWTKSTNPNKRFVFEKKRTNAYYTIVAETNANFAMDCKGKTRENGTAIQGYSKHFGESQQFYLKHLGNGRFKIYHKSGLVVCLKDKNNTSNGNKIHLWSDHNAASTEWYLINANNGQRFIPKQK